ncbi:ATP-binding protein [Streptomyces syringium]|uniref:ATP-binding protein n=1 Tax=Streptomyces syringium TaxID=76729 RepID=UPI0033EA0AD9
MPLTERSEPATGSAPPCPYDGIDTGQADTTLPQEADMLPRPAVPAIAPFEYCLQIPHDPRAVGVARASLRSTLSAHELPELIDRAELLVSELLTNAIVHTYGPADLRLTWGRETLRMTVWDTSPKPPNALPALENHESGRGLALVHSLADRWDYFPLDKGPFGVKAKAVWCEIGRPTPTAWAEEQPEQRMPQRPNRASPAANSRGQSPH